MNLRKGSLAPEAQPLYAVRFVAVPKFAEGLVEFTSASSLAENVYVAADTDTANKQHPTWSKKSSKSRHVCVKKSLVNKFGFIF